ncbi:MAG: hypothetical protein QGH90_03955 [Candidatus Poseidoniaceae archaeon]|jgi:hypothetical protein|nr:hypothetical protein [Candidatus Poseidoniaceae archaeon]MDP7001037.1 hypothetical protein [Candidatus Poseidoniaceae archaeon]
MANVVERGSFVWFLMAATQMWITVMILDETTAAVETLFGTSAAACFVLGLFVFKKEQVDLLNNPNKVSKEVHEDMQKQQGRGFWWIILLWFIVMSASTYFF